MSLSKAFNQAKEFGLSDDQVVVQVTKAYLKDCYGIEAGLDTLETMKAFPTLVRNADVVGVFFPQNNDLAFFPLIFSAGALSLAEGETKDKVAYPLLNYNVDTEAIKGADASYAVPALFSGLNKRAYTALFGKSVNDATLAPVFLPGAPVTTPDGDYAITDIMDMKDAIRVITDTFSVRVSAKDQESLQLKKGSVITIKEFRPYAGETALGGGGGNDYDLVEIPAQVGFKFIINEYVEIGSEGKLGGVLADNGTYYWANGAIKDLRKSLAPRPVTGVQVEVIGINTKDDKSYAKLKLTKAKA